MALAMTDGRKRGRGPEGDPACKVFVYNLPWGVDWPELKAAFADAGRVVYAGVMKEHDSGRSKGCGIVEFESREEAQKAIVMYNGTEMGGRQIFVRLDIRDPNERREDNNAFRPVAETGKRTRVGDDGRSFARGGGQQQGYGYGRGSFAGAGGFIGGGYGGTAAVAAGAMNLRAAGGVATIGRRLFVSNLSYETTWQALKDHFKQIGPVAYCTVLKSQDGRSKGVGIVEFEQPHDALRAISRLSNSELLGRQILVREDQHEVADPGLGMAGNGLAAGMGGVMMDTGFGPGAHALSGLGFVSPVGGPTMGGAGLAQPFAKKDSQIVVHGLPYSYADIHLKDMMRTAGHILKATVVKDATGKSRGFGVVAFESPEQAQAAIQQFNGQMLHGRVISVKLDLYNN